jgi:hypothetical protein
MITTPSRFGTTCRTIMVVLDRPSARAASMNSRFLSDSVWPRTMRAMSSQETAPIATKTRRKLRPKSTVSTITSGMNGTV